MGINICPKINFPFVIAIPYETTNEYSGASFYIPIYSSSNYHLQMAILLA